MMPMASTSTPARIGAPTLPFPAATIGFDPYNVHQYTSLPYVGQYGNGVDQRGIGEGIIGLPAGEYGRELYRGLHDSTNPAGHFGTGMAPVSFPRIGLPAGQYGGRLDSGLHNSIRAADLVGNRIDAATFPSKFAEERQRKLVAAEKYGSGWNPWSNMVATENHSKLGTDHSISRLTEEHCKTKSAAEQFANKLATELCKNKPAVDHNKPNSATENKENNPSAEHHGSVLAAKKFKNRLTARYYDSGNKTMSSPNWKHIDNGLTEEYMAKESVVEKESCQTVDTHQSSQGVAETSSELTKEYKRNRLVDHHKNSQGDKENSREVAEEHDWNMATTGNFNSDLFTRTKGNVPERREDKMTVRQCNNESALVQYLNEQREVVPCYSENENQISAPCHSENDLTAELSKSKLASEISGGEVAATKDGSKSISTNSVSKRKRKPRGSGHSAGHGGSEPTTHWSGYVRGHSGREMAARDYGLENWINGVRLLSGNIGSSQNANYSGVESYSSNIEREMYEQQLRSRLASGQIGTELSVGQYEQGLASRQNESEGIVNNKLANNRLPPEERERELAIRHNRKAWEHYEKELTEARTKLAMDNFNSVHLGAYRGATDSINQNNGLGEARTIMAQIPGAFPSDFRGPVEAIDCRKWPTDTRNTLAQKTVDSINQRNGLDEARTTMAQIPNAIPSGSRGPVETYDCRNRLGDTSTIIAQKHPAFSSDCANEPADPEINLAWNYFDGALPSDHGGTVQAVDPEPPFLRTCHDCALILPSAAAMRLHFIQEHVLSIPLR